MKKKKKKSEEDNEYCLGAGLCSCNDCKTINVLTRDQTSSLIKIIEKLEESPLKNEFIEQLNDIIIKDEKSKRESSHVSMKEIMNRFTDNNQTVTIKDLQEEIKILKQEIQELRENDISLEYRILQLEGEDMINKQKGKEKINEEEKDKIEHQGNPYISILSLITTHKWNTKITLILGSEKFTMIALIDSGADINCIQEGLIPTKYYEKTLEGVTSANGSRMHIQYKLPNAKICKNQICFNTAFVLVKNINTPMILGTLIKFKRIEEQLKTSKIQEIIKKYENKIIKEICETNPTAFWHRKKYEVSLPYIENFDENKIPTKARPIQMNKEYLDYCKKEIQEYLEKKLIRPSKSPWSCTGFYVMKASEVERGAPRLVINYKPLNKIGLKEQVVKYHSGIWHPSQQKYSTVKKEILSIVLCVQKFQDDVFNKKFLIRTDCKAAPSVLTKDVQNLMASIIIIKDAPLGSDKQEGKIQYGPLLGSNKIEISSSSTSTGPTIPSLRPTLQNPTKPQHSLAQILKNPIPRPTNPLVSYSNRFTPLYFNTIAQPKSHLITSILEPSNDTYIEKPELLPIMTLEPYMIKENLKDLIAHIFPKSFHYLSNDFSKSQRFYEFILVDTDSAEITHNKDDQGNILFSKMKIMNILSPQDWDQSLFDSKSFSRSFNPTRCLVQHSLLYHFGPLPEIFPQQVTEVYNYFKESSTFVPRYRIISFVASQSITWILAWDYMIISQYESEIIDMKMLTRKIKVKWWRKFNIELISKAKISELLNNNKTKKLLPPKA
ncbi:hypothetical protein CR513_10017, partial [Mucuna pruriens]